MAKLYGKFRALSRISENKPKFGLTKQTWSDIPFIIRGKDEGVPAWHYILVPFNKLYDLKNEQINGTFDFNKFGSIIKYIDDQGQIIEMSGWGNYPPTNIQIWFNQHYHSGTIDENVNINYLNDDIRLCTMQRIKCEQLIGICRRYNKENKFHYIELFDDYKSTLAYRSGIKNFDRFIYLNGINIEQDTIEQLTRRFNNQLDLPVQMLVCSPATYHYYKSNNIILHQHLPTIQHLKPVFDISLSDENLSTSTHSFIDQNFYVVQFEIINNICVVSQSSIFKSPNFTNINDICFIEIEQQQYKRGKILFKGSKDQCQHYRINLITQLHNYTTDKLIYSSEEDNDKSISSNKIVQSRFEDLPNELLFDIFNNLRFEDLYNGFINLNYRFDNLVLSHKNVSLIFDENSNLFLIKCYGYKINNLIIDTYNQCDLNQFYNLDSLILLNRNQNHLIQIRPDILPNLVNLSLILKSDFKPPFELVNQIFSNKFSNLRYVNLGRIDKSFSKFWSKSPSLKILSIRCDHPMIIEDILQSCPNLFHLQIHILYNCDKSIISSVSSFIHPLERFTLWSEEFELSIDIIDSILSYMINIKHFYLQTICRISFSKLIENIVKRLNNLSKFDCFIKELIRINDRIDNLNNIHQISSCFNRIQCIKQNDDFRIFATE